MNTKQFRIGYLAKELQVERFVIRFWEKEFNITSLRSEGGQRFYTQKDLATFKKVKKLLYEEGFTIAGAKKALEETSFIASKKTKLATPEEEFSAVRNKLLTLRKQLLNLYEVL